MKGLNQDKLQSFQTIGDLLIYAISDNDIKLAGEVLKFLEKEFDEYRQSADDPIIEYPPEYCRVVYDAVRELLSSDNKKLELLIPSLTSSYLLTGEPDENSLISENTYRWMWSIVYELAISGNEHLILNHWFNAHYYISHFKSKYNPSDASKKEYIERFIEFHLFMGGLMVFQKRIDILKRMLTYTTTEPPRYHLIPIGLDNIFKWYLETTTFTTEKRVWRFRFPNTDGIKADSDALFAIRKYIVILFARQFKLVPGYHYYGKEESSLAVPPTQKEKRVYLNGLASMRTVAKNINTHEMNKLIHDGWREEVFQFIAYSHGVISESYYREEINQQISESKRNAFMGYIYSVCYNGMSKYDSIFRYNAPDNYVAYTLEGQNKPSEKAAFADDQDVSYDQSIINGVQYTVLNEFKDGIAEIFLMCSNQKYLLRTPEISIAISKLIGVGDNEDYALIGFGLTEKRFNELVPNQFVNGLKIELFEKYSNQVMKPSLFLIRKSDLPSKQHLALPQEDIEKFELDIPQGAEGKYLYGGLIDLNQNEILRDELEVENLKYEDLRKYVLRCVQYHTVIKWRKGADCVQIEIVNDWDDITSDTLEDIIPFE